MSVAKANNTIEMAMNFSPAAPNTVAKAAAHRAVPLYAQEGAQTPEVRMASAVTVQHTSVSANTSKMPHMPCSTGSFTSASQWTITEVPSPASLEKTPIDMLSDNENKLFIDLAVPRDIDPAVEKLAGARLIDMDFFTELAKENNLKKLDSVERSKLIIDEETDELEKQLMFHDFLPQFESLDRRLCEVSAKELFFRLKSELDSQTFGKVIEVIKEYGE